MKYPYKTLNMLQFLHVYLIFLYSGRKRNLDTSKTKEKIYG